MIYHGTAKTHEIRMPDGWNAWVTRSDLSDLAETVNQCVFRLGEVADKFDSIVVTGMSGALVGSPVSLALHKPLVVVRKYGDRHHSDEQIINEHHLGQRFLFLDDFIAGGDTHRRVIEILQHTRAREFGLYLYDPDELITNPQRLEEPELRLGH